MSDAQTPHHLIRLADWPRERIDDLLSLSDRLKQRGAPDRLAGRTAGLLFFRGSLRTRSSFEAAMYQLGGNTINMSAASDFWELESQLGSVMDGKEPEHVKDVAAVLSSYVNVLAIRPSLGGTSWSADRHDEDIQTWAEHARVPVINMESALWHPLQALADVMTMREQLRKLAGARLSIVWTRSPTPATPAPVHSLLHAALRFGMDVRVAHPPGFELDRGVMSEANSIADECGGQLATGLEMAEAVKGTHIVYGRSWQSLEDYGNPTLAASRRSRTTGWTIDQKLMSLGDDAHLMHAMPVRRNLEVSDEVLDGDRSLVYAQAANRLHSQKALLTMLLR